jgi:hypothetical protein
MVLMESALKINTGVTKIIIAQIQQQKRKKVNHE